MIIFYKMWNLIIPSKNELEKIASQKRIIWHREEKQRWTNCSWETINYINEKWENIKLFTKKSFLKMNIEIFESDYLLLKSKFKNIIPNRWFVWEWWNIFVFCAPISVKVDIFLEKNLEYIKQLIKNEPKLLKQLKFFIKCYEDFINKWKILDLYWQENLVISDDNKLYYLDSFLVFHDSSTVKDKSLSNFQLLKDLIIEIENNK